MENAGSWRPAPTFSIRGGTAGGGHASEGDLRSRAPTQPWRRTISAIHNGANGEVQFGGVG